ncbi:hypothetical protein MMC31_003561 [Peltigera leucophlebia]|nr:hypothetical protein [Peltigera leucophlebia]
MIFSSLPLPVEIIYKFPSGTWVENIAIRSNGLILAAILFTPEIYQVDPKTRTASLVAKIPAASGILDIVEIEEDVFYVAACNFSDTSITPTAGNFSVWRVDVNTLKPENTLAKVEKIVDIPQAKFLNGATLLSRKDGTLLFADSVLGSLFRVSTRSKEVKIVITDPLFGVTPNSSLKEGVNGLKLGTKGNLLFTSTNQNLLGEISINSDGTPKDKGQVLSSGIVLPDDFAVGPPTLGIFVSQNGPDQLSFVPPGGGKATVVVGAKDQPGLKGPTSAAIGKGNTKLGRGTLYVGTNGGVASYLNGSVTARGTISRIDIEKFY